MFDDEDGTVVSISQLSISEKIFEVPSKTDKIKIYFKIKTTKNKIPCSCLDFFYRCRMKMVPIMEEFVSI